MANRPSEGGMHTTDVISREQQHDRDLLEQILHVLAGPKQTGKLPSVLQLGQIFLSEVLGIHSGFGGSQSDQAASAAALQEALTTLKDSVDRATVVFTALTAKLTGLETAVAHPPPDKTPLPNTPKSPTLLSGWGPDDPPPSSGGGPDDPPPSSGGGPDETPLPNTPKSPTLLSGWGPDDPPPSSGGGPDDPPPSSGGGPDETPLPNTPKSPTLLSGWGPDDPPLVAPVSNEAPGLGTTEPSSKAGGLVDIDLGLAEVGGGSGEAAFREIIKEATNLTNDPIPTAGGTVDPAASVEPEQSSKIDHLEELLNSMVFSLSDVESAANQLEADDTQTTNLTGQVESLQSQVGKLAGAVNGLRQSASTYTPPDDAEYLESGSGAVGTGQTTVPTAPSDRPIRPPSIRIRPGRNVALPE